ncbi:ATP-binding protein [Candidatus Omnitrophota bacterium]
MTEHNPLITSEGILDSLKKKISKLSYLHEISHSISSFQDVDELLDYTLSKALESLDSQSGSIFLWDDEAQELRLHKIIGRDKKQLEGIKRRLGEGIAGLVAKQKKPILVKDIKTDPRFGKDHEKGTYKTNSFLCVPMVARDKLMGVINITEKSTLTPFNTDELELLFILANHLAIAVDNLRLYARVKRFNSQLESKVKEATQELKKTIEHTLVLQRYKENILESLTTGIYVLDRHNRITLWNRGMELKYGIKREEVIGKELFEVLKNVKPEILRETIEEVNKKGKHVVLDLVNHRVTGDSEMRTINYHIFPLTKGDEENLGVVVLLDDVTEKVQMEQQLRVNEKLAAIGKLSAGIAHELNNPLDGTRRYVNLALDALDQGDTKLPREFISSAKQGLNRMIKIVRSLLEFSRQTQHTIPSSVNVNDVLKELVHFYSSDPAFQNVKIETQLSPDIESVVDYGIQNVFSNLIKNGLDAIPHGGILKIVTECFYDNEHKKVKVIISDTGSGIPEDLQERIFEPFYTTKKMGEGTGLGLAICDEIVNRSGGIISVKSNAEQGTEFTVVLPSASQQ